jgi:hypothetical protein
MQIAHQQISYSYFTGWQPFILKHGYTITHFEKGCLTVGVYLNIYTKKKISGGCSFSGNFGFHNQTDGRKPQGNHENMKRHQTMKCHDIWKNKAAMSNCSAGYFQCMPLYPVLLPKLSDAHHQSCFCHGLSGLLKGRKQGLHLLNK